MRTINSIKNISFGLISQLTSTLIAFVTRTIFIYILGVEYLGIQGLFTNILSILSLANLGFGTAIVYSLYKPISEKNTKEIKAYMNLYKKFYRVVASIVLIVGIALIPYLDKIVNLNINVNENLYIIYFMFLMESVVSYLCIYKQSILIASQKSYHISKIHTYFLILSNFMQIMILVTTKAYIPVLTIQILLRVIENIIISKKADKKFPYLKDYVIDVGLSHEKKKALYKNVYSMFMYKISGTIINSTDNIVISYFIGVVYVGIYSNYILILSTLKTFVSYIFSSLTASVGNLVVSKENKKKKEIFDLIFFISFWIYGVLSIILFIIINEFIEIWLGSSFLLSKFTVFIIILDFYTAGIQSAATMYRDTTGMFSVGKYRPIIASILNLLISILLVQKLKIAGVLLGTIISRLCVYFWFDPYIIYKNIFKEDVKKYFIKYFLYCIILLATTLITSNLCKLVMVHNRYLNILLKFIICSLIPNIFFIIVFFKSREFKSLICSLKIILIIIKRKLY